MGRRGSSEGPDRAFPSCRQGRLVGGALEAAVPWGWPSGRHCPGAGSSQGLPFVPAASRPSCRDLPLCVSVQSDPEFAQWKKELTETFTEAQRVLRRAPKFLNRPLSSVVELSKPPLCHRNSNGL